MTKSKAFSNVIKLRNIVDVVADFGADPNGVVDSQPAFTAALASGAKIIMAIGRFKLSSPIIWNVANVTIDGGNRISSEIFAGAANISTGAYPNALFVCATNAINGTLKSIRFPNGLVSWTGWVFSAVEGGSGGAEQAAFSMAFTDLWVDPGTLASGFFTGGLHDSWVDGIQFENCKTRFYLNGAGVGVVNFTNILELSCYDPFINVVSAGNNINVSNYVSTDNYRGYLFNLTGASAINIENVSANSTHGTLADPTGFMYLSGCTNVNLSNFVYENIGGVGRGITIGTSEAKISDGWLKNVDGTNMYPIQLSGAGLKVMLDNVSVFGGATSGGQIVTGNADGRLTITGGTFLESISRVLYTTGGDTLNVTIDGATMLNSEYVGGGGATLPMIVFDPSANHLLKITNCEIGLNDSYARANYLYRISGAGQAIISNNHYVSVGRTGELDPGGTLVPIYAGTNVGGICYRTGAVSPVGAVTPLFLGEIYRDTVASIWYKAFSLVNTDWTALN